MPSQNRLAARLRGAFRHRSMLARWPNPTSPAFPAPRRNPSSLLDHMLSGQIPLDRKGATVATVSGTNRAFVKVFRPVSVSNDLDTGNGDGVSADVAILSLRSLHCN